MGPHDPPVRVIAAAMLLAIACGPDPGVDSENTGTSTGAIVESTSESTTNGDETTTSSEEDADSSSTGLLSFPDTERDVECDLWTQTCPQGQKCTVWANGVRSGFNATRCIDVARNPSVPGETCTVSDGPLTGIDDCALGSLCYYVDEQTLTGECVAFCRGSEADPSCPESDEVCVLPGDSVLPLCRRRCDPLAQDCPSARSCVLILDEPVCEADASGSYGTYGDPCEFANACDPGLICGSPEWVPGCVGPACCTPFCDVTQPEADAQCPGVDGGQQCIPLFEDGQAPEGDDDVGVCAIPN